MSARYFLLKYANNIVKKPYPVAEKQHGHKRNGFLFADDMVNDAQKQGEKQDLYKRKSRCSKDHGNRHGISLPKSRQGDRNKGKKQQKQETGNR